VDLLTGAYKAAAAVAQRVPGSLIDAVAPRVAEAVALRPSDRRLMVERHQRRVRPDLEGAELAAQVRRVYRAYGSYYGDSFRLPSVSPEELDAGFSHDGYHHVQEALEGPRGPILVMPHLGSWEWAAFWLSRVRGHAITAVAERLEPPELFDWFTGLRRHIGIDVLPLGAEAGRGVMAALRNRHVVALLCDRDITGGGVEVSFFGEKTTLPSGPAALGLRTGAPMLPTAVYERDGKRHGVVRPPIDVTRTGRFRDDVARVTQSVADVLEDMIREAPDQWHLMQPNWPSDHEALRERG
jgi:KDO2-lipid IV(A) lauroyltransferase